MKIRQRRARTTTPDGFPGYVRGWCCMAKAKTMQRGYRDVGYLIAVRVRAFRPAQFNARSWRERVACLGEHVSKGEAEAIRIWFKTHYPALMHLIPERRQREFVAGFIERAKQEQQELIRLWVV